MDEITRQADLDSARDLRAVLAYLDCARQRLAVAAAGSDACAMPELAGPLATLITCVSIKIAAVEATATGTDKPYPKLHLVKG